MRSRYLFSVLGLACFCVVVALNPARANPFATPDQMGQRLMHEGKSEEAARTFVSPSHRALALASAGDTAGAMEIWASLGDAESEYNLGTTLTQAGDYQRAIEAFERAESLPGTPADTANNKRVAEALQALQENQQQQSEGEEEGGQSERSEQGASGDSGSPDAPDQDGQSDATEGEQPTESEPSDPQSGRQQQAEPDNSEARERQQATDQLLQRVPDDPAGLLRARIVREHQRRHGGAGDAREAW